MVCKPAILTPSTLEYSVQGMQCMRDIPLATQPSSSVLFQFGETAADILKDLDENILSPIGPES